VARAEGSGQPGRDPATATTSKRMGSGSAGIPLAAQDRARGQASLLDQISQRPQQAARSEAVGTASVEAACLSTRPAPPTGKNHVKRASGSETVIQSAPTNVFRKMNAGANALCVAVGRMFEDNSVLPEIIGVMVVSAVAFFLIFIFFGW
jgi:hypothetical protein